ncbi:response regulator [Rickettsiales bacterium]|nr:response regulator [Rickettsiales bacterium]
MTKKVLIVDDSPTMRSLVKTTLQQESWETITAQNGLKALKEIRNESVDLIITDINMPDMGGIELITELRKNDKTKSTPILIITTEGNDKTRNAGKEAGASGWIVKPFDPRTLLAAVNKLTG